MASKDRRAQEERQKKGIDLRQATDKELGDYVNFKLYEQEQRNRVDIAMWEDFRDDFKDFIADTFNALSTRNIRDIKIVLLTYKVFIKYKGYIASKAIANSLVEVVTNKEEH